MGEIVQPSDLDVARARLVEAEQAYAQALDAEFCKPTVVRTALTDIARALGGINDIDTLNLYELSAKIHTEAKRTHDAYQSSLWPKGRGC